MPMCPWLLCVWWLIHLRSDVDGQVLVLHDMIGLTTAFNPRFLRRYMNLYEDMTAAIKNYVEDVKEVRFPNQNEQY